MPLPLSLEGSINARDLAGLHTPYGPLQPGRLIRSGNLSRLTVRGRAQLRAAGVSRIVDVRGADERRYAPAPFLGEALYLNIPALPHGNRQLDEASAAAQSNVDHYRAMLEHAAGNLALILQQIVDAPPGAVLIHCHSGKDRTGLAVALALFVTGVSDDQIAADYAETDLHLQDLYAEMLERQADPEKRAELARFLVGDPADMRAARFPARTGRPGLPDPARLRLGVAVGAGGASDPLLTHTKPVFPTSHDLQASLTTARPSAPRPQRWTAP